MQKPVIGILLYILFTITVTGMNAGAKTLQNVEMHSIEIAFIRNLLAAIGVALIIYLKRSTELFKTKYFKAQMIRSMLGNTSLIVAFWAVSLLPLADIVALWFCVPLVVMVFSAIFLGEKIGIWRIFAVVTGLLAVMMISQPAIEMQNYTGILVGLLSTVLIASVTINLRHLAILKEHALTTTFFFLTSGTVFCGLLLPFFWTGHLLNFDFTWIILIMALCGLISQIVKTEAFRHAEASLLSPFGYLNIFWATLMGWLLWNEIPDLYVMLGCTGLIFSNMLVLWRESRHAKVKKQAQTS